MSVRGVEIKVGDKLRYLGGDPSNEGELTRGRVYDVVDIDYDVIVIDTINNGSWAIGDEYKNVDCFEKVEEDGGKTALDLIANLAQEVTELKSELKTVKEELSIHQENLRTWSTESTKMAYDLADLERKTDEHIDMFIDDISMLDERTQIKKEAKIEIDGRELVRKLLKEEGVYVR